MPCTVPDRPHLIYIELNSKLENQNCIVTFVNAQPYKSSNVIFIEFAVGDLSTSIDHSCVFVLSSRIVKDV